VITVVLNGEKYLEQTIQSVINQTYPNVEYIIIDGGSTDGTLDIIKKYEDYIDYWVSEPDKGIYDAMNKGIRCSLGQWIGFLGSDDVMNYSWLESAFKYWFTNRDKNYIYGDIIFIINNKDRFFKYKEIKQSDILKKDFIIPHSGSIANRELFKKNIFDINFRIAGDYAWVLSNLESLNVLYIPQWQIKMRIGGTSSNWKYLKKHYNELKIIEKKFKISISKKRKIKEFIKLFISKFPQIYLILQKIFWFFKSILSNLKIA
jgi:glycosyltransferase involved in cell wall biosynthesis